MVSIHYLRFVFIMLLILGVAACSSDDDKNDSKSPAPADTLTVTNTQNYSQVMANTLLLADPTLVSTAAGYGSEISAAYNYLGIWFAQLPPGTYNNLDISGTLSSLYDSNTATTVCNSGGAKTHVSGSISVTYNGPTSYSYSGSINFNNLCLNNAATGNVYINGGLTFSGDQAALNANLNNLTVNIHDQENIFDCTISVGANNYFNSTCEDFANANISLNNSSDQASLSGISFSADVSGTSITIDGRLNSSVGYINVTTTTPLLLCGGGGFQSGLLTFSGSNNSSATLDFTDETCSTATWCTSDGNGGETCDTVVYR